MADISYQDYQRAESDVRLYEQQVTSLQIRVVTLQQDLSAAQGSGADTASIQRKITLATENLDYATQALAKSRATVSEFLRQPTVPSASDAATAKKYENSEVVAASTTNQEATSGEAASGTGESTNLDRPKPIPVGAIPPSPKPASVNFRSMAGDDVNTDLRVKIRVPNNYLTSLTQGPSNELRNLKGIIFPYTPSISIEHKADYASQAPMHSNYAIYFYQRSSISPINISGQFTVANESEAAIYIATVHLLRALTKMRSGGATGDADSGAPPPVCRLDAYGTFMLQNVPVAISSFKIDFPDNVDYYTLGKKAGSFTNSTYEMTAVPVVSTISVTCIPMYSRDEMQKFNVTQWLDSKYVRKAGYL